MSGVANSLIAGKTLTEASEYLDGRKKEQS
jgi:hypothetical protein